MKWFEAIFRFWVIGLSDDDVEKEYIRSGARFGDMVSYINMGECSGFKRALRRWTRWENEYARRGYRTLSVDAFWGYGGYGIPLVGLRLKRESKEAPIFHAELYRERYLGKIKPVVTAGDMLEGPKSGTYALPSTEIRN